VSPTVVQPDAWLARGRVRTARGRFDLAERDFEVGRAHAVENGFLAFQVRFDLELAHLYLEAGQTERAARVLDQSRSELAEVHLSPELREELSRARESLNHAAVHSVRFRELTARELDVVSFLPTRMTNREIAEALYVSTNTIKHHLKQIYRKLHVDDRDAVVRILESEGPLVGERPERVVGTSDPTRPPGSSGRH